MSTNVFGSEVTEMTVREMPGYDDPDKEITRFDLAKVAMDMSNDENKVELARAYLDELKAKFGNGVCTKVLFYNATGAAITFVRSHDWHGHVGESPYPTEVRNGQWGVFFHQKPTGAAVGSEGAVVFRLDGKGLPEDRDWMFSWSTPWGPWYKNHCYTEIHDTDHYFKDVWGILEDKMVNSGSPCVGCRDLFEGRVSIGGSTTAECQATIRLVSPSE